MHAEIERREWRAADLEELLIASSRTFALAIPHLPEPTRREVTIAYLLFRVADTFEDATSWPRSSRIEALERFVRKEPLRRVHECVFGVLALESEPVDPRL